MKYVIKYLAHSALLAAFVYIFYFQGQLGNYNFWEWCWTIVVSFIGLANYGVLTAASDESGDDEQGWLSGAGFVDFLILLSIWLMAANIHFVGYGFLLGCIGVFILSSGMVLKFSFSLISFASLIWLFVTFNSLSSWHSWVLFFAIIISCCYAAVVVCDNNFEDEENKSPFVGLLVGIGTFLYAYFLGSLDSSDSIALMVWLGCLICSFIAYIRNNAIASISVVWLAASYSVWLLFPWVSVLSWSLIGVIIVFSLFGMFFYNNLRISYINLVKEYISLGQEYSSYRSKSAETERKIEAVIKGVVKGVGSIGLQVLKGWLHAHGF